MTRPTWTRRCPRKSGWYAAYFDAVGVVVPAEILDGTDVYVGGRLYRTIDYKGRLWFWPTPIRMPKVRKHEK